MDILIIDDGSNSEHINNSNENQIYLCRLESNYGLGFCTHIAIDFMIENNYDILIRVDADGQHPIEKIPSLIKPLIEEESDFAVGRRINHEGDKFFSLKKIVKKYYNFISSLMTKGRSPSDVNSGFFAINIKSANYLNEKCLERYPEPEIYIHLCRSSFFLKEIDIMQNKRITKHSTLNFIQAIRMFYRFNIFIFTLMIDNIRK